jgi:hypothetical protein
MVQVFKIRIDMYGSGFRSEFKSIKTDKNEHLFTNTNTNTNNLFPPIPCDTIMFIYDNYDNKYDNTISCLYYIELHICASCVRLPIIILFELH